MNRGPRRRFIQSLPIIAGVVLLLVGAAPAVCMAVAAHYGQTGTWSPSPTALSIIATLTVFPSAVLIVGGIIEVLAANRSRPRD
jgi:hypothetical protein